MEKERQALARIQTQSLGLLRSSSLIKMTENSLVVGWWRWTRTICSHGAHLASFVFAFSSLGLPHTLSSIICFILFSKIEGDIYLQRMWLKNGQHISYRYFFLSRVLDTNRFQILLDQFATLWCCQRFKVYIKCIHSDSKIAYSKFGNKFMYCILGLFLTF